MVNIKSYKDGDRLILVVENCTGELAVKVNKFLSEIIGLEAAPTTVPALAPPIVEEETIPNVTEQKFAMPGDFNEPPTEQEILCYKFTGGPFSGTNLKDALKKAGVKAAIEIACNTKALSKEVKGDIVGVCKQYLMDDLCKRDSKVDSLLEISKFFKLYYPLIKGGVEQILSMSGYSDITDFLDFSDEQTQRDAYESIIQGLSERVV